jgi:hypothetical protein
MTSRSDAIRPEGECLETSEARPWDTSLHITLPPGVRRFTATFTLEPEPDQLPPNSPPAESEAA